MATANNLAVALVAQDLIDEALPIIDALIESDPGQHLPFVSRANCLVRLSERAAEGGDAQLANDHLTAGLAAVDRALELSPRFPHGHRVRGRVLTSMRRSREALVAYRRAIEPGQQSEDIYLDMVRPARHLDGQAGVEHVLREGIEANPQSMRLRFELCGVRLRAGEGALARDEQREMFRLAPARSLSQSAQMRSCARTVYEADSQG